MVENDLFLMYYIKRGEIMIANERYFKILDTLNQKQSITINEMTKLKHIRINYKT